MVFLNNLGANYKKMIRYGEMLNDICNVQATTNNNDVIENTNKLLPIIKEEYNKSVKLFEHDFKKLTHAKSKDKNDKRIFTVKSNFFNIILRDDYQNKLELTFSQFFKNYYPYSS